MSTGALIRYYLELSAPYIVFWLFGEVAMRRQKYFQPKSLITLFWGILMFVLMAAVVVIALPFRGGKPK